MAKSVGELSVGADKDQRMHVFSGTVAHAADHVRDPQFIAACVQRFTTAHGVEPGDGELGSWRRSWPVLMDTLTAAGLGNLHILLEYPLPGTGERIDALLLGQRAADAALTAVVVELKQWEHAVPRPQQPWLVDLGARDATHPARQVGSYVHYLTNWLDDSPGLEVKGVVIMHNATPQLIEDLNKVVAHGASAMYPILGREDLYPGSSAHALATRLGCDDLRPASPSLVARFLQAQHRPSPKLLSQVAAAITGSAGFTLIGEQDRARLTIYEAAAAQRQDQGGRIIAVTGGPGTGKTAIATRVLGDLCRQPHANPRLLSPSGALTQQLTRAVGRQAKGLIATITDGLPGRFSKDSIVLIDEAHRLRTNPDQRQSEFPPLLQQLARRSAAVVLFLDERQIIRPFEGTTLEELRRLADHDGHSFDHIDLTTQFRCSGSQSYLRWIDALFAREGTPLIWSGNDYDLALAHDPDVIEAWTNAHIARGHSARITAGFCWPWASPARPPLRQEVSITWTDENGQQRRWQQPWNSRASEAAGDDADIPGRPFWATDPGGHRQIGCIYTAQGMEYDYGAVIIGDDLVRTPEGWRARPDKSHDPAVRRLPPEDYLIYALNTYRVLATRGTLGTRLYATDPATQRFLDRCLARSGTKRHC